MSLVNCTNCKYDLTGLIATGHVVMRCPECGQLEPLTPRRRPPVLWRTSAALVLLSSLCVAAWFGWWFNLLYPRLAPINGRHVLYLYLCSLAPLGVSTAHWASYRRIPGESMHVVDKALWVLGISIVIPIATFVSYVATLR